MVTLRNSLHIFLKTGAIKNFTKIKGKHQWCSLFYDRVAGHRPTNLLKKRLRHSCFLMIFTEFVRATFL